MASLGRISTFGLKSTMGLSTHLSRVVRLSSTYSPVYQHALKHGDRVAIIDDSGSHSYTSLHSRARALARQIQSEIPGAGSKVTFLTPSSSSYIVAQWGVWMAGGVCVPLCPSHPLDTLKYYVEDSGAHLTLTTPDMKDKLSGLAGQVVEFDGTAECAEDDFKPQTLQSRDPAMILYTSGTTGLPKGVVLSHGNLDSQAGCLIHAWKWAPHDTLLHMLPLHHTHGIVNCLLCPLTVGASVRMLARFEAGAVFDSIINKKVNLVMAVPTIYAKLLQHAEKEGLSSHTITEASKDIRLMVSGSAALPTPVLEKWKELTGHTLLERYGMTEIGMALSNPLEGTRTPGAVGSPLPGVKARIVRWTDSESGYGVLAEGDSSSVSVDISEEGELLISGPNVFQEYLNKPEATKKEFTEDGWFKTGDTAKVENGIFKILGRTSVDIIKSGGYKISALDVERILLTHQNIQDIAVVGVEDLTWGQKVAAVVVLADESCSLSLQELRSWCSDKMAKYWIPTELRTLPEMPRNVMGKVNKKELIKTVFTNK